VDLNSPSDRAAVADLLSNTAVLLSIVNAATSLIVITNMDAITVKIMQLSCEN
jgi:hypothetical protein